MSIGLSPRPLQGTPPALDFSALNGQSPQQSAVGDQQSQQSIDPGALLFNTGKQQDVNFGPPNVTNQNAVDGSKSGEGQDNVIKMLTALLMSLIQMLMKMTGQDKNPANEQQQQQDPYQNNSGLGTQPTDSGGGGDGGGVTPDAAGGGGGTPTAAGGDGGGDAGGGTPTTSGSSGGGSGGGVGTPTDTGAGTGIGTGTASGIKPVEVPKASGDTVTVNETIKVGPGQVFDGGGKTYTAGSSLGNGDQSENQKPLFELAEGATLKNVNLGENAADGIHVRAANDKAVTIQNLHAANVGEDLITVKGEGGAKVTNLNILDSSAKGADDKVVQLNANTHLNMDGFKADNFGTLVRTNGGKQFDDMDLKLNNVEANHGKFALVKSDSEDLKLATSNIAMTDVKHAYDKTKASTQHTEA
ncbi:pectate lyase [Pseudomonas syringae]|uniref:pectate lyase n=1 Tax=Pseudomonas syringae CC1417 TaxID=1357272 RepID=A0AAU8LIZ3_PSESX